MQIGISFGIFLNTASAPLLDKDGGGKGWIQLLMEYSLQDLIEIGLPYLVFPLVPLICASLVYDPTMKLLLYVMLPESYRTWPWFCGCLIAEAYFVLMLPILAVPVWQVQVMAFELVNSKLEIIFAATSKR